MAGFNDAQALLLQVSADISGLKKQMERAQGIVNDGARDMERRATSLGKSVGVATAAVLAGITGAVLMARQAMDFADEIADTAAALHISTDALQEYRYALRLAGGEADGADGALARFSATLGKAQQGLTASLRAFEALGFTPAQIKSFKSADDALKAVSERIAGLSTGQQKDAAIKALGLEKMAPLILQGADAMQRLRREAHAAGVVMDEQLVKRGADAKDQFDTITQVIGVQLKSAFVDLAPVIVGILGLLAQMAKLAGDVVNAFRSIENKTTAGLTEQAAALEKEIAGLKRRPARSDSRAILNPEGGGVFGVPDTNPATIRALEQKLANVRAQLAQRAAEAAAPRPTGTNTLRAPERSGGGPTGPTAKEIADRRTILDLENQLAVAEAANNEAEIRRLKQRLELIRLIADFEAAGYADAAARGDLQQKALEAARQLAFNRDFERGVDDYRKREAGQAMGEFFELRDQGREAEIFWDEQVRQLNDLAEKTRMEEYEAVRDGILDGLYAAANGDGIEYLAEMLKRRALEGLADGIAQALQGIGSGGGGGGGGFGRFLRTAGQIFGIPGFAGGTDSFGGGFARINERGPEGVAFLPRGTQIIPNDVLRNLANLKSAAGGGSLTVNVQVDARDAVLTETVQGWIGQAVRVGMAQAARGAYEQAMRDGPSRYQQFQKQEG